MLALLLFFNYGVLLAQCILKVACAFGVQDPSWKEAVEAQEDTHYDFILPVTLLRHQGTGFTF